MTRESAIRKRLEHFGKPKEDVAGAPIGAQIDVIDALSEIPGKPP
jgi:hypothetical protein